MKTPTRKVLLLVGGLALTTSAVMGGMRYTGYGCGPEARADHIVQRLTEELDLSPYQHQQLVVLKESLLSTRQAIQDSQGELRGQVIQLLAAAKPIAVYASGNLRVDAHRRQVTLGDKPVELSSMEYSLLDLFVREPGKVFHRDEILNHLKGIEADVFSRSVDILVSRLRQKLKPLEPIKTVRGQGYVFVGLDE